MRAVSAKRRVDDLEAANEIEDFLTFVGAARGLAKVRSAAEWAVFVNPATRGFRIEQRTGAIGALGQLLASGGAHGARGNERLAAREVRHASGDLKVAALGEPLAVALNGALLKFGINRADLAKGERLGLVGFRGCSAFHFLLEGLGLIEDEIVASP